MTHSNIFKVLVLFGSKNKLSETLAEFDLAMMIIACSESSVIFSDVRNQQNYECIYQHFNPKMTRQKCLNCLAYYVSYYAVLSQLSGFKITHCRAKSRILSFIRMFFLAYCQCLKYYNFCLNVVHFFDHLPCRRYFLFQISCESLKLEYTSELKTFYCYSFSLYPLDIDQT